MRIKLIILSIASILIVACSTNPFTGRKQITLLPESLLQQMSLVNYQEFLNTNHLVTQTDAKARMVSTVGRKIAGSVEKYLTDNGKADEAKQFDWVFNLVDDNIPNAWCMPGGKVVVYTGILPFTKDKNGLATVMGHEIAHAVAKH